MIMLDCLESLSVMFLEFLEFGLEDLRFEFSKFIGIIYGLEHVVIRHSIIEYVIIIKIDLSANGK